MILSVQFAGKLVLKDSGYERFGDSDFDIIMADNTEKLHTERKKL
jgi:hypothetical protein